MNIRPLRNLVLIRRNEAESVSKGGIIIPDVAKEKPLEGTVLAMGPGVRTKDGKGLKPMGDIKVGDKVLFGKYSTSDPMPGAGDVMLVPVDDIRGVVEE